MPGLRVAGALVDALRKTNMEPEGRHLKKAGNDRGPLFRFHAPEGPDSVPVWNCVPKTIPHMVLGALIPYWHSNWTLWVLAFRSAVVTR